MGDLIVWGLDIRIWQVIATLLGAATTASIAVAAWVIAYRNNFGWRPVVLFTGEGSGGVACTEGNMPVHVNFDVINRRKYPIVVRRVMVIFEKSKFRFDMKARSHWLRWPDPSGLTRFDSFEIGASDRKELNVQGVLTRDEGIYWKDKGELIVIYFDLKSNKDKTITHKFAVDLDDRDEQDEEQEQSEAIDQEDEMIWIAKTFSYGAHWAADQDTFSKMMMALAANGTDDYRKVMMISLDVDESKNEERIYMRLPEAYSHLYPGYERDAAPPSVTSLLVGEQTEFESTFRK